MSDKLQFVVAVPIKGIAMVRTTSGKVECVGHRNDKLKFVGQS